MRLRFELYSAGVLAPGVRTLPELLSLRRTGRAEGAEPLVLPLPMLLPANERRRTSPVARLALACAEQALLTSPFEPADLRCVFASDEGTGEVCQQMLDALATRGEVSPLLFHNSVHNAPSGYFSIAYRNHQPALSVSMGHESFASGLLCAASEACTTGQPVLFLAYDAPVPEPMHSLLPIGQATACAWVIASGAGSLTATASAPIGAFELSLHPAADGVDPALPAWLPAAWALNSSAQAFVALALLAGGDGSCEFGLGAQRLRLTCGPAASLHQ